MRAFLALTLPDEIRAALEGLQLSLPFGRLVAPENLHLTLAFLDEQPAAVLEDLHAALTLLRCPGFSLGLSGLGSFGGKVPVSLHVAADPTLALLDLHRKIRATLHGAGLMLPHRRFHPHVTLARFRHGTRPADMDRLAGFLAVHAGFRLEAVPVQGFAMFASTLGRDGAHHEVLAEYPLL